MSVSVTPKFEYFGSDKRITQSGADRTTQAGSFRDTNGSAWVDVTSDVLFTPKPRAKLGIRGSGPLDRVSPPQTLRFSLNNSVSNSVGLQGAYSIGHKNERNGWGRDVPFRVNFLSGVNNKDWYYGYVSKVSPIPGIYGKRSVKVNCVGWMEKTNDFLKSHLLDLVEDATSNTLYQAILTAMTDQPVSTSFATGVDTIPYAFHRSGIKEKSAQREIYAIATSVFDYLFVTGGGILVSQNRLTRVTETVVQFTLDETMTDLGVEWTVDNYVDRVRINVHPVKLGTSEEFSYELDNPVRLNPGESKTIVAQYKDPNTNASVGMKSPVTPVADTHYKFGAANDGLANDLNDDLGVVVDDHAAAANITFTNNGEGLGHVNVFKLEGILLRFEDPIEVEVDVTGKTGDRELSFDMPYQHSDIFAENTAKMIGNVYGMKRKHISKLSFTANRSSTFMANFLTTEIGERIEVIETVTGTDDEAHINGVSWQLGSGNILDVSYILAPVREGTAGIWGTSTWNNADWRFSNA